MPVVSFELGDETQFPLGAQGVVEPQRPAQLAHAQVPLQGPGVLGEGEALLLLLPQRNRFAQTVDELKGGGEEKEEERNVSDFFFHFRKLRFAKETYSTLPARAAQGPAGGGIVSGR